MVTIRAFWCYIARMKQISALLLCSTLIAAPLQAQDSKDDLRDGMDLLSQGTQLLLRSLMGEIEPALKELEGALGELNAYHPPEILPNGDIIIRRKQPKPTEPELSEDGEVEL